MPVPEVHILANGAAVICDAVADFDTLALSVVAGRGSRWEEAGQSGWSHLLEHMVFKGAGGRTAKNIVEDIEADGGQINAATGHERTSFQVRALAGGLPLALAVTGDLVQRPILDAEDLAREKHVVLQEIAEAADAPDDQVFELAQSAAFSGQSLGRPILGAAEAIGPATPDALGAWRAGLYSPDRLVISAAGAVDADEFLRLAERDFGEHGRHQGDPPAAGRFTGGAAREKRKLEQAHLVFLLPAAGILDPHHWALRLFVEILGGGMSSRLFQEARERLGLAYAIDAYSDAYSDVGVVGVYAGCAPVDAGRLAEVAALQIRRLIENVTSAELARAKAQLKAALFMGRESLAARAEQAATQFLAFGRLLSAAEMACAIETVRADELALVGARLLDPRLSTVSVLGPKAAMDAPERFEAALFA